MENTNVKRLIRSKSGLRIVAVNDEFVSPFLLCEPPWIPDNEAPCCMECKKKFDFLTRRHHCRRCGRIYCKHCCDFRLELPRMCFVDPVRQCQGCAEITRGEKEFFDKDVKMLIGGASFHLSDNCTDNTDSTEYTCKLTPDHRSLTLDGGVSGKWESVELARITELNVLRTPEQPPGLLLSYDDPEGGSRSMTLLASAENRRQAASWLLALHSGFRMAAEGRPDP